MSTTKVKASANGTSKKTVSTTKAAPAIQPQANLENRIQRVTELQGLTTKRGRVLDTLNQLRTFKFSGDDSCILEIKDAANNKFSTSNNNLINLLSEHLETLLQEKLNDLNRGIVDFQL